MARGVKVISFVLVLVILAVGLFMVGKLYFSPSYMHYRVGERFFKQGRYRAAYEEFKKAFELDPYNRAARQRLADLKRILGENERVNTENQ